MKNFNLETDIELNLENFLNYYHLSLVDFYGKSGDRSFRRMLVLSGLKEDFNEEQEKEITKKLKNLFSINSRRFIEFTLNLLKDNNIYNNDFDEEEMLMVNMIYYTFYNDTPQKQGFSSIREGIESLLKNENMAQEIISILRFNYNNIDFIDEKVELGFPCPLDLHCEYSRDVIMAALGYFNENKKPAFREGVKYFADKSLDIFFITLNKSDKDFSPSTLYEDYAINESLFHWQSQSTTSVESTTGNRYINHKALNSKIALFVRESKEKDGITSPFTYLGLCEYVSHSGNKPISFVWKLEKELPAKMINKANKTIVI